MAEKQPHGSPDDLLVCTQETEDIMNTETISEKKEKIQGGLKELGDLTPECYEGSWWWSWWCSWWWRLLNWFRRAPVKVFVVVTDETFGAHEVLLEKAKILSGITESPEQCDVIIVFCPITSRVGSDVESAMTQTIAGKPVILVLMHHTLDPDDSTGETNWSEEYPIIKRYIHVLYHETERGLLNNCEVNDRAVQQLQEQLHKHSHCTWR